LTKVDFWKCSKCDFQTTIEKEKTEHIKNNIKWENGEIVDNPDAHIMTNLRGI